MTMIATGVGPSIKRERKKPEAWNEKNSERKKQKMFFQKALNTQNQKYTSITVHKKNYVNDVLYTVRRKIKNKDTNESCLTIKFFSKGTEFGCWRSVELRGRRIGLKRLRS